MQVSQDSQPSPQAPQSQEAPHQAPQSDDPGDLLQFDIDKQVEALSKAQRRNEAEVPDSEPADEPEEPTEAREFAPKESEPEPKQTEQEAPKPAPKEATDKRLANLHQREQALLAEKKELLAQREEVEQWHKLKKRGRSSPFEALKALGWESAEEFLTSVAENGGKMSPEAERLAELEERLAKKEAEEKEYKERFQEEQLNRQREERIAEAKSAVAGAIQANPEWKGTLISKYSDDVFSVLQNHFLETEEELPLADAVKKTQDLLHNRLRNILDEAVSSDDGRKIFEEFTAKLKPSRAAQVKSPTYQQPKRTTQAHSEPSVRSIEDEIDAAARKLTTEQRRKGL